MGSGHRRPVVPLAVAVGLVAVASCNGSASPPPDEVTATSANLESGVAAVVGTEVVEVSLVGHIAAKMRVSPKEARDRAVTDTLFALHAEDALDGRGLSTVARRSVLARAVLRELDAAAREQGPPTDDEVERVTKQQWLDFDRPVSARTVHFIALTNKAEDETPARSLAERFVGMVEGITDKDEFIRKGETLKGGAVDVKVEDLPPVTPDGRIADLKNRPPPGIEPRRFDVAFATAANAIPNVGDKSPVTESPYGWHVIMLLERIPEERPTFEERRRAMHEQIMAARADAAVESIIAKHTQSRRVEIARAFDELTRQVKVHP